MYLPRGRWELRWRSVEGGITRRHKGRYQAFKIRRKEVKQGTYVESRKSSPITPQIEWDEAPIKETAQWHERKMFFWGSEAQRMFITSRWWERDNQRKDWEIREARREWKLQHLEIPFLRQPTKEEKYKSILEVPDNQEAIQEMVARNPLFKEKKWAEEWLDWLHPERIEERRLTWEEERRAVEEMQQRAMQQQAREFQAQALVQNRRAEPVEQNLVQWIRQIKADEHARLEYPTERRTRERRQEIQDHRRFLERDGRFQEIVPEVRRLPNGPECQEAFRRFRANLYTQEYQNPLAREKAVLLALRFRGFRIRGFGRRGTARDGRSGIGSPAHADQGRNGKLSRSGHPIGNGRSGYLEARARTGRTSSKRSAGCYLPEGSASIGSGFEHRRSEH
jgi:hypothetical protein